MIRLQRPDGSHVYMGGGFIVEPAGQESAQGAKTKVTYGGAVHYVLDEPEFVIKAIQDGQAQH
jgi:hypothetical protein